MKAESSATETAVKKEYGPLKKDKLFFFYEGKDNKEEEEEVIQILSGLDKKGITAKRKKMKDDEDDWEKLLKLISPDNFPNWEIVKRRRPPFVKRRLRIHNKGDEVS